jgi:4-alpha-glucanotransferase
VTCRDHVSNPRVVRRDPAALDRLRRELKDQIDKVCFSQFLLCRQGERLKACAHSRGIGLIGDLPFFVSADSSDLLNLGREARMNIPGRAEGNWRWRCTEDMLSAPAFQWLRDFDENLKPVGCCSR